MRQRPEDRRPRAIPTYGKPHRQAAFIGKPLGHHRNGRGVPEPVPQPADHSEAQVKVVQAGGVRAQVESQAHQDAARQRAWQRPELILNSPRHYEAEGKHDHRDREHHGRIGPLPSEPGFQRRHEHAPGIQGPQRQVHRQAAYYPPPAAHPGQLVRLHPKYRKRFRVRPVRRLLICCRQARNRPADSRTRVRSDYGPSTIVATTIMLPSMADTPTAERRKLRVFLCHASDDKPRVRVLDQKLWNNGFQPWLDERHLLAGQEWETAIRKEARESDVCSFVFRGHRSPRRTSCRKKSNSRWMQRMNSRKGRFPLSRANWRL